MNLARLQHRLGLAMVIACISTYCLADGNLALFMLAVPGAIAAWVLTTPPYGQPLPRIAINLLLLAILVYALQRMFAAGFTVSIVCEIITLTLLVKIMDRRSQRDNGQIVSICTFLGIGAILTSNALGVGLLLMLCLALVLAATLLHQIALPLTSAGVSATTRPPAGPHASRHLRRLVFSMMLSGVAISVIVFLVMPRRLGEGLFGPWGRPAVGQVTGFADEIELGTPGFITPSSTAVLDLEVFGPDGQSLGAPGIVYYLRGAVLDTYENGRWTRSKTPGESDLRRRLNSPADRMPLVTWSIRWTTEQRITIRNAAGIRSHLFSIWRPVSIQAVQPITIVADREDGMMLRDGGEGKFEYIVRSRDTSPRYAFGRPGQYPSVEPVRSPNLNSDRFRALAAQILTQAGLVADSATRPPEQVERAAETIARSFDKGFVYTLEAEPVPSRTDPTEWFLFDRKAGHCEYYASAMAILCRSVGINARVITGYVATEFNEPTSHYVVRQSNAHAWVEVEVAPGVWKTFDPTPAADFQRVHEPSQSLLAKARRMFDAAEYAWIRTVVSFDGAKQQSLFRSAFNIRWQPDAAAERMVHRLRSQDPRAMVRLVASAVIVLALVSFIAFMLWHFRAALAASLASAARSVWMRLARPRDTRTVYLLLLREFRARGLAKPIGTPLLTHVKAISPQLLPDESNAAERVARRLYEARFGSAPRLAAPETLRDLRLLRSRRVR